jgi:hypothetical protein
MSTASNRGVGHHRMSSHSPLQLSPYARKDGHMPPRRKPHRECRDYEKEWNGRCVDKHLEDEWLVRLNDLLCLRPISVCEGHADQKPGSSRTFPHIKLRLQEQFLASLVSQWGSLRPVLADELHRLFHLADTYAELELKCRLRWGRGRFPYRETLTLRIHARQARTSEAMDAPTYQWFEQTLSYIEEFDKAMRGGNSPTG